MSTSKRHTVLHMPTETPSDEVMVLADAVGKSPVTLTEVIKDFLEVVHDPIVGFAMAHHGLVRATVDIDVLAMNSVRTLIKKFTKRGY